MCSGDHLQIISVIELLGDILTKGVTCSSRIHTPACPVIRVRPQEVAHGSLVRNFLKSFKGANVVECLNGGRESSVKAEELVLYYCGQGKKIEELSQAFPDVAVPVLSAALVIEPVDLGDLTGFVIASQNGYSIFVSDFEREQKSDCFDGVVA